jgi:ATP-dependent helicase/nuclease subunit A
LEKPFHIYRSSAGSGKTRTLAREYIRLALRHKEYFKYIVAMTFTNKSTQEMKDRVLSYLSDFAEGKSKDLADEIIEEQKNNGVVLAWPELKKRSEEVLVQLLHHYSEFSISTIDAFFQRVIRSFTRETGLLGNFRLEVDSSVVHQEVIDLLMDQLSENAELRGWVLDFSMEKLANGDNWDIRSALLDFARLTEREEFKIIEEDILKSTDTKDFFKSFRKQLNEKKYSIEQFVFQQAQLLLADFDKNQLEVSDFKYGASGSVYTYVHDLTQLLKKPGKRILDAIESSEAWPSPSSANKNLILSNAENKWRAQLSSLVEFIEVNLAVYLSASKVLKYLYAFGLLADILRTKKKYLHDENLMLLSDAPKFLNKLMQEQDTSFIYEKVGSFYRHFLLDEFQDTSGLQWKNLLPLLQNGIAQNYQSLIVGDIKQSIYRWRGGDLSILQQQVRKQMDERLVESHTLNTNYRSDGNIVRFNNALFSTASKLVADYSGTEFPKEAYLDVEQNLFVNPEQGYVKIQFLDTKESDTTFQEEVLLQLPSLVEQLQEKNIPIKEIAFLVRDNREGKLIAKRFMEYRVSAEAKPGFQYGVVSNESLQLDKATCIVVLLNALRILENPAHQIARAHLAYEYQKLFPTQTNLDLNQIFSDSKTIDFKKWVPPAFLEQQQRLASMPLFEMVENLISIFNLGKIQEEIVYLQSFQDVVQEFSQREKNDLTSFFDWWELNKHKKSVQVAGGAEAAQILTIHRAKGLQFKYVIIPFLNWELGHGSKEVILWCNSEEALFREVGFVPIRYKQDLADTVFKEAYEEETKKIYLDNLNLLYVACTRSEAGLIAFAPTSKQSNRENKISRVGQLVNSAIQSNEFLQSNWSAEAQCFELGEIQYSNSTKEKKTETVALRDYVVTPWRDRLQVHARGMEFFRPTQKRNKINYGIFIHAFLSQIYVKTDAEKAFDNALRSGIISLAELVEIKKVINWLINHPQLQLSFDPSAVSKMEVSLFAMDGAGRRMDRVSIKGKEAWIVDYKTGLVSSKDESQVMEYKKLLRQMGYEPVTGFLVYLEEQKVVEVKD